MKDIVRSRFWVEAGLGAVTGVMFLVTLVWSDWIEILFQVDPDSGSGTLEWVIVGSLLILTVVLFALAGYEWRRARTAAQRA